MQYLINLLAGHVTVGWNLLIAGNIPAAKGTFRKALAIGERVSRDHPESAELASCSVERYTTSRVLISPTIGPRSRKFRQGITHQKRAAVLVPGNVAYRGHLRNQLMGLGSQTLAYSVCRLRLPTPLKCYREAKTSANGWCAEQPDIPQHKLDLAAGHTTVGNLLEQIGRKTEAIQSLQKALATLSKLAGSDPGKPEYDDVRITTYNALSKLLSNMGQRDEALESTRKSLMLRERRSQAYPDNHTYLAIWPRVTARPATCWNRRERRPKPNRSRKHGSQRKARSIAT